LKSSRAYNRSLEGNNLSRTDGGAFTKDYGINIYAYTCTLYLLGEWETRG